VAFEGDQPAIAVELQGQRLIGAADAHIGPEFDGHLRLDGAHQAEQQPRLPDLLARQPRRVVHGQGFAPGDETVVLEQRCPPRLDGRDSGPLVGIQIRLGHPPEGVGDRQSEGGAMLFQRLPRGRNLNVDHAHQRTRAGVPIPVATGAPGRV